MQKILVYLTVFLDVLWIGILIPAFPELVKVYGVSNDMIARGVTLYAFCTFFSTPLLGQWSDRFGRKPLLLFCVAGTFLSFLMLLFTHNFWLYLVARVINGLTGGNISILQSIISDISASPEERRKNFGLMGALFGMWFIVGPLLWSLLLELWVESIFFFGTFFSFFQTLLIAFFLKETHYDKTHKPITFNSFSLFARYLANKDIAFLMFSFFLLGLAGFTYQSVFTLFMDQQFQVSGQQSGYILAMIGAILALNQAVLLSQFWLRFFTSRKLIFMLHLALVPLFYWLSLVTDTWFFIFLLGVAALFQWLINPLYQAEILEKIDKNYIWELNGVMSWLGSITMFLWPILWSILLAARVSVFSLSWFFVLGSLIILLYHVFFSKRF